ncbi:hypothetical protein QFZ56_007584 [Streptomyces achromogenes]|uniref:Uncharacterized protein n=1 Tax=Streptomyces achromogenes TaxID=67255 RepID=A0ABU0QE15_STRAH|nr:hypothetical protein [Streptomyces achromogenes]MDQ0688621.1 hypothetical protein [Streptomyces achromogenes]
MSAATLMEADADIDHRGTTFTPDLISDLLWALDDPATRRPRIGAADLEEACFEGDAMCGSASSGGTAWFKSASFAGDAWFDSASFEGGAGFESASFAGTCIEMASRLTEPILLGLAVLAVRNRVKR